MKQPVTEGDCKGTITMARVKQTGSLSHVDPIHDHLAV